MHNRTKQRRTCVCVCLGGFLLRIVIYEMTKFTSIFNSERKTIGGLLHDWQLQIFENKYVNLSFDTNTERVRREESMSQFSSRQKNKRINKITLPLLPFRGFVGLKTSFYL